MFRGLRTLRRPERATLLGAVFAPKTVIEEFFEQEAPRHTVVAILDDNTKRRYFLREEELSELEGKIQKLGGKGKILHIFAKNGTAKQVFAILSEFPNRQFGIKPYDCKGGWILRFDPES